MGFQGTLAGSGSREPELYSSDNTIPLRICASKCMSLSQVKKGKRIVVLQHKVNVTQTIGVFWLTGEIKLLVAAVRTVDLIERVRSAVRGYCR